MFFDFKMQHFLRKTAAWIYIYITDTFGK